MLGLVLLALLAMPAIAQSFNVVDMGVLRGGSARVHGINAAGMAVGGSGFVTAPTAMLTCGRVTRCATSGS